MVNVVNLIMYVKQQFIFISMSERSTIEIIGSSRKYINQYEISTNFNLPNSSLKKHCVIPIVGKYNGYTIETDVINGEMNGKTIVRNGDGVIMEEMNLVNDSREGECLERGADSKLVIRGMYKDDKELVIVIKMVKKIELFDMKWMLLR